MCTKTLEFTNHLKELKQAFMKDDYHDQYLDKEFKQLSTTESNILLTPKLNNASTKQSFSCINV